MSSDGKGLVPGPTGPDRRAVHVKTEGEGLEMNTLLPWQLASQMMEIRRSIVPGL